MEGSEEPPKLSIQQSCLPGQQPASCISAAAQILHVLSTTPVKGHTRAHVQTDQEDKSHQAFFTLHDVLKMKSNSVFKDTHSLLSVAVCLSR